MIRRMSSAQLRAMRARCGQRRWSNATPTDCTQGHGHASKLEARVCGRLTGELRAGQVLVQQVRLPLVSSAPDERGRVLYMTIDFAVIDGGRVVRLVDAKGRKAREWDRGARALEASWGIPVEVLAR